MRSGVDFTKRSDSHFGINLRVSRRACPSSCCIKRLSAPFSSMCVAQLWRNKWQLPCLPMSATLLVTSPSCRRKSHPCAPQQPLRKKACWPASTISCGRVLSRSASIHCSDAVPTSTTRPLPPLPLGCGLSARLHRDRRHRAPSTHCVACQSSKRFPKSHDHGCRADPVFRWVPLLPFAFEAVGWLLLKIMKTWPDPVGLLIRQPAVPF